MNKGKGGRKDMAGPLYSNPDGKELGAHKVEGPRGGMVTPDPIGFGHGILRKGPGGKTLKQSHDLE